MKGAFNELEGRLPSSETMDMSAYICSEGGSATVSYNNDGTRGTYNFNGCRMYDGMVYDGTMTYEVSYTNNYELTSMSYSMDMDITYNGVSESYSGSQSCTFSTPGDYYSATCTTNVNFADSDGYDVEVEELSVTGDDYSGYEASGTIRHQEYGTITFETDDALVYGSCDHPSSGSLTVADGSGNTATFIALSCSEYQICYTVSGGASTCETYNW